MAKRYRLNWRGKLAVFIIASVAAVGAFSLFSYLVGEAYFTEQVQIIKDSMNLKNSIESNK